jgi:hypothetical protein
MKIARLFLVSLFLAAPLAEAQRASPYPAGAEAREARLHAKFGPRTRAWVQREAQREAALPELSESIAVNAVRQNLAALDNPRPSRGDIDEIAFLVLMQASRHAQQDVRTIQGGLQVIDRHKQDLRVAHAGKSRVESSPVQGHPSQAPRAASRPATPQPLPKAAFDARLAGARNNFDSLSEMGEMESLRLQMAMDRLSKMMSTLSNLLKKTSDTSNAIIQNIK